MHKAMDEGAGIYRNEEEMQKTCNELRSLRQRFKDIIIEDRGSTFNTELISAFELDFMLDVAETVANSALSRKSCAARTPAPTFLSATTKTFSSTP